MLKGILVLSLLSKVPLLRRCSALWSLKWLLSSVCFFDIVNYYHHLPKMIFTCNIRLKTERRTCRQWAAADQHIPVQLTLSTTVLTPSLKLQIANTTRCMRKTEHRLWTSKCGKSNVRNWNCFVIDLEMLHEYSNSEIDHRQFENSARITGGRGGPDPLVR